MNYHLKTYIKKASLLGMLTVITACQQPKEEATEPFDMNFFFPLMAWDDVRDESTIQKMSECGINSIAFVPPTLLDACQKYGMKAIVFDQGVTPEWDKPFKADVANKRLGELIEKYNDHPAVYGYHLKDEPYIAEYGELGKSVEFVKQHAPGKWPYINLFPNYRFPDTGEWYAESSAGDWYKNEYLQRFVDECKGLVLSYDNYSLIGEDGFSDNYWTNLWDVRLASLRNNLPFHTIVLSVGFHGCRIPTTADLSIQVFGALAYGARGIGYWKFVSEVLTLCDAPELGDLRGAPLDEFGEPTAMYPLLKNLNYRISNMIPVLLKLRSDDVYHIGEIPEKHHGVTEQNIIQGIKDGGKFVVGEFTHTEDGSRWVMVVNKDLKSSALFQPLYNKEYASVQFLCMKTGKLKLLEPWYALAPGHGVLLRLE